MDSQIYGSPPGELASISLMLMALLVATIKIRGSGSDYSADQRFAFGAANRYHAQARCIAVRHFGTFSAAGATIASQRKNGLSRQIAKARMGFRRHAHGSDMQSSAKKETLPSLRGSQHCSPLLSQIDACRPAYDGLAITKLTGQSNAVIGR